MHREPSREAQGNNAPHAIASVRRSCNYFTPNAFHADPVLHPVGRLPLLTQSRVLVMVRSGTSITSLEESLTSKRTLLVTADSAVEMIVSSFPPVTSIS